MEEVLLVILRFADVAIPGFTNLSDVFYRRTDAVEVEAALAVGAVAAQ